MKVQGDQIIIDIGDLLTPEVLTNLCKQAVFSECLAEFVVKTLTTGGCVWDDDEYCNEWKIYGGCPEPFEKARQEVASLQDEITKKLITDLTSHRDKLNERLTETRSKLFSVERQLDDCRDELRRSLAERVPS